VAPYRSSSKNTKIKEFTTHLEQKSTMDSYGVGI
jgi:hypothetical protein